MDTSTSRRFDLQEKRKTAAQPGGRPRPVDGERQEGPEFRLVALLALLVLAAGLIGGGWYGHSRIHDTQTSAQALGATAPGENHTRSFTD